MWGFDLFLLIVWPKHFACGIVVPDQGSNLSGPCSGSTEFNYCTAASPNVGFKDEFGGVQGWED